MNLLSEMDYTNLGEQEVLDEWNGSFRQSWILAQVCVRCMVRDNIYVSHREAALAVVTYSSVKIR